MAKGNDLSKLRAEEWGRPRQLGETQAERDFWNHYESIIKSREFERPDYRVKCLCPEEWMIVCQACQPGCPNYQSCGGWTWDPPCGGCDSCMLAQACYYDEEYSRELGKIELWQQIQIMNA